MLIKICRAACWPLFWALILARFILALKRSYCDTADPWSSRTTLTRSNQAEKYGCTLKWWTEASWAKSVMKYLVVFLFVSRTLYINKFHNRVHFLHQIVQCAQNVTTQSLKGSWFKRELVRRALKSSGGKRARMKHLFFFVNDLQDV